jgi:DUF4097 and DUF4098 domain-containing protein YvlB
MSKSRFLPLGLLAFALVAASADGQRWGHNLNMNTTNSDSTECQDHIHISSDDLPVQASSEEVLNLANSPISVAASQNGGIHVRTWDKNEISVKLCRAAAARTQSEANSVLSQVHLNHNGDRITVDGPEGSNNDDVAWSSVLLVFAPRGATLDLSVHNGGISLNKVDGNITAHALNGGISLKQTTGKINVEAQNGGVSIKDCGGDVTATVQNGGLSIQLGQTWNGTGLDAKSHNGGLVVEIPRNFSSSLEVSAGRYSSLICKADACQNGEKTWDDNDRIFRIGTNPVIKASTVNGGTVIKERGTSEGDI